MILVCLVLSLYGGWEVESVGMGPDTTSAEFKGLMVADGRNDGVLRVYAGSQDHHVYEFSYINGNWERMDLGSLGLEGLAHGIHVAPAHNDDTNRVYASTASGANYAEIYEFTWNGSGWTRVPINKLVDATYDVPIGYGRNDDTLRIYTGTEGGECFEYTWRGGSWSEVEIGGTSPTLDYHQTLWVGEGRNDGITRVYAACQDGNVWEFTYSAGLWQAQVIDDVEQAWDVKVAEGRNDGVKRLYVTTGSPPIPPNPPGYVYEYTWDGSSWDRVQMVDESVDKGFWGLAVGEARNDGRNRVYAGTFYGSLYELTWQGGNWQHDSIMSVGFWRNLHDMVIERGRNDDTLRIYASSGFGHIYEFTYRPEAGVMIWPDSTAYTDPGSPVTYNLWVRNTGPDNDTMDITSGGTLSGWTVELLDLLDADSDGTPDVGALATADSTLFRVRITPPGTAVGGTVDSTRVIASTSNIPTDRDTAWLVTVIGQAADLDVEPDREDTVEDGEYVDYPLTVHNYSNFPDRVDLFTAGTLVGWSTEFLTPGGSPLPDNDSDGTPDVGPLAAYTGEQDIVLRVTCPLDESDGTVDVTYAVGQSDTDPVTADSAVLTTTVFNPALAVTVEPDTAGSGPEGEIIYHMRVINEALEPDSFTLSTASDLGWAAEISDASGQALTNTGSMQAGETLFVDLAVTIPEGIGSIVGLDRAADTETRWLVATSLTDPDVVDTAQIVTLAVPPLDIHNYPNPFTGPTSFIYSIPSEGEVTIKLYTRAGEHLMTFVDGEFHTPGIYTIPWDGKTDSGQQPAPGVLVYALVFKPSEGRNRRIVKSALLQP